MLRTCYLMRSLLRYGLAVRCGLDILCSISQNIQTKPHPDKSRPDVPGPHCTGRMPSP